MRDIASHMARGGRSLLVRIGLPAGAAACLLGLGATSAQAASAAHAPTRTSTAAPAPAHSGFRPRIHGGLGLVPPVNRQGQLSTGDLATGAQTPETYHGGPVMSGAVTFHTIFWSAPGHSFQGSSGPAVPTYVGLVLQFVGDFAADTVFLGSF